MNTNVSMAAPPRLIPLAGMPPPHVAHERLAARHATTFILESRDGPAPLARYSIVGWAPAGLLRVGASGLQVEGNLPPPHGAEGPIDYMRRVVAGHATRGGPLPFAGGFVGCAGYDFARVLEPSLEGRGPEDGWPRLVAGLYLDALVYDHATGEVHYVTAGPDRSSQLATVRASPPEPPALRVGPLAASLQAHEFTAKVRQAQGLLRAGECFQIVLSRAYVAHFTGDLAHVYRRLRDGEPAPYLYHLRFGGRAPIAVLGASPETLVRVRGGRAETFPIAGTRPLTGDPVRDRQAAADLQADPKEAAEHAMLVDLARNDLASVSRPGTVKVARLRDVVPARTVQHLVSQVQGELAPGRDALDALAAVFPAGTVSGAPKLRAMEHIAHLEPTPRGPYGGAVLYASFGGDLDSAITIRSLSAIGDRLTVQAGAGIVLASDAAAEFEETRRKAATMLDALRPFGALAPAGEVPYPRSGQGPRAAAPGSTAAEATKAARAPHPTEASA